MHRFSALLVLVSLLACGVSDDDDSSISDDDDIFAQDDDDDSTSGPGPGDDDDSTSGPGPGDDDDSGGQGGGGTNILGDWSDAEGNSYNMTESVWTVVSAAGTSTYTLSEYSTDNQFAVGQNGASNPEHPSLFSRFEWIAAEGPGVFLCHSVQDAADALTAGGVAPADPSNPTASGCAGGPWTALSPL